MKFRKKEFLSCLPYQQFLLSCRNKVFRNFGLCILIVHVPLFIVLLQRTLNSAVKIFRFPLLQMIESFKVVKYNNYRKLCIVNGLSDEQTNNVSCTARWSQHGHWRDKNILCLLYPYHKPFLWDLETVCLDFMHIFMVHSTYKTWK